MRSLQIGDRVCYTANWIRSVGANPGPLTFARGVITGFVELSHETRPAMVAWNCPDAPGRVNVNNLCKPGTLAANEVRF